MASRILVVDDEPGIVASVRALLEASGYAVTAATSGRGALEIIEREAPDVIVLDLGLPDVHGVDVCRIVRKTAPRRSSSSQRGAGATGARPRRRRRRPSPNPSAPRNCARIIVARGASRRSPPSGLTCADLTIDRRRRVHRGHLGIRLTPKEFACLCWRAVACDPGRFSRRLGAYAADQLHLRASWSRPREFEPDPARLLHHRAGGCDSSIEARESRADGGDPVLEDLQIAAVVRGVLGGVLPRSYSWCWQTGPVRRRPAWQPAHHPSPSGPDGRPARSDSPTEVLDVDHLQVRLDSRAWMRHDKPPSRVAWPMSGRCPALLESGAACTASQTGAK